MLLLGLVIFSLLIGKGVYFLKRGFSLRKILSPMEETILLGWGEKSENILRQPFYYLGKGRQCFAFESADRNYVLKIPRTDIYLAPFWVRTLRLRNLQKKIEEEKRGRKTFLLKSFVLSYQKLREETGIIALHIGKNGIPGTLLIKDAFGSCFSLPIDSISFALQKKSPPLVPRFLKEVEKGDWVAAKSLIKALFHVIESRAKKGILNRDRSFLRNFGFDGESAHQIDIGSFFEDPSLSPKEAEEKSFRDSTDPIYEWLATYFSPSFFPRLVQ